MKVSSIRFSLEYDQTKTFPGFFTSTRVFNFIISASTFWSAGETSAAERVSVFPQGGGRQTFSCQRQNSHRHRHCRHLYPQVLFSPIPVKLLATFSLNLE